MKRAALALAALLLLGAGRWGETSKDNVAFAIATADTSEATGTPAPATGLSFPLAANLSYGLECYIETDSADTTGGTGVRLGLTGPAAPTSVTIRHVSATADTTVANKHFPAFGSVHATINTVPDASGDALNTINAIIRNGPNAGTLQVVVTTETAGAGTAAIVKRGSYCELHVLAGG